MHLHSQHWTHLMCQGLSRTLSRNLSRIGFSQLAHWSIVWTYSQPGVRDVQYARSVPVHFHRSRKYDASKINANNHMAVREVKRSSSVPRDNNPHVEGSSARQAEKNCWKNSISQTKMIDWWSQRAHQGDPNYRSRRRKNQLTAARCVIYPERCLQWMKKITFKRYRRAQPPHLCPISPLMGSQPERSAVMSAPLKAQPIAY